ncbi:hypothetical protein [Hymenobacter canadensis]|uniref:Uncharacterized protein n=1 Tax=Hymenobacter canadensis TaxID=2999067 RepID=A0ABY7LIU3_9BACT|nr:hypothetical protein [Hymenobacter canadensis]WBA40369.1 hypothetical protein O3303_11050 [Hymenobacter canadensis]
MISVRSPTTGRVGTKPANSRAQHWACPATAASGRAAPLIGRLYSVELKVMLPALGNS